LFLQNISADQPIRVTGAHITYLDAQGQPIRSDGQPWPPRPAGLPEDAEYDEGTSGWLHWRSRERRFWTGEGVPSREQEFDGCRKTAERTYDESGRLLESSCFSSDGQRHGEVVAGVVVRPFRDLRAIVREHGVAIGVIATPAASAQDVADQMVDVGITSILNFAPTVLNVGDHVAVSKVDLSKELQVLAYHEQRKATQETA